MAPAGRLGSDPSLEDVYVFSRPEQARTVYEIASDALWAHCRIRVNLGKLVVWSASGAGAPADLVDLNSESHVVWRGDAPPAERGMGDTTK